jgi:hypothetical protein
MHAVHEEWCKEEARDMTRTANSITLRPCSATSLGISSFSVGLSSSGMSSQM